MFDRQFAKPSGLFGKIAGRLMARRDADDHWVVELLELSPDDRVLDVGCGPGVALELMLPHLSSGLAAGVDPSEVMLLQAAGRNKAAVRAGKLELRLGDAGHLPFPDVHFSKACAIHSVYFWQPLDRGLRELHRVLQPGGRLVLAVRARRTDVPWLSPSRRGYGDDQVAALEHALEPAGFAGVHTQRRDIGSETIVAVSAEALKGRGNSAWEEPVA